ncbi:hypothetical protein HAX54_019189, partial [Datura stramonium]|nr:hypothetical protein [Datura stramonium]
MVELELEKKLVFPTVEHLQIADPYLQNAGRSTALLKTCDAPVNRGSELVKRNCC